MADMARGWAFISAFALAWLATTCAGQAISNNDPDCVTVQSPEEVLKAVQAGGRAATVCVPQGRSKCVAVCEIDTSCRERGSTWPRLCFTLQLNHVITVHRVCCFGSVQLCQLPNRPRLAECLLLEEHLPSKHCTPNLDRESIIVSSVN